MSGDEDKEVSICSADQQKINRFARLNNRTEDLKEELRMKKAEVQTLEDASSDLMMLEDDEEKVPFQVGEVFVYLTQDDVQAEIEKKKDALGEEIKEIDDKVDVLKTEMSDLKTKLYAKFGNAINLEADEE